MPICKYARPCVSTPCVSTPCESKVETDGRPSLLGNSCDYFFSKRMKLPCLFSKIGICLPFVACLTWLRM